MFTTLSTARRFHVVSFVLSVVCFALLSLLCQSTAMGQEASGGEETAVAADDDAGKNSPGDQEEGTAENADKQGSANETGKNNANDQTNKVGKNEAGNANKSNSSMNNPRNQEGNEQKSKNNNHDGNKNIYGNLYSFTIFFFKAIILALMELVGYVLLCLLKPYFYYYFPFFLGGEIASLQSLASSCKDLDNNVIKKKNPGLWESFMTVVKHPISFIRNMWNGKPEDDNTFLDRITTNGYNGENIKDDWNRARKIYFSRYWGSWLRWFEKTGWFTIFLLVLFYVSKNLHLSDQIVNRLFG